jgi:Zn-dependent protease
MPIEIIFSIIILIFSVILHEIAHGFTADYLGDRTARLLGRLTLNPIPHIDVMGSILIPALFVISGSPIVFGWAKPVPFNPRNISGTPWKDRYGGAIVAVAGPATNVIIAIIFGLFIRFGFLTAAFVEFSLMVVVINISLAVFNLIPVPPLDGHHIVSALLPANLRQKYLQLTQYGFILMFLVVFLLWQFVSPVVTFVVRGITGL